MNKKLSLVEVARCNKCGNEHEFPPFWILSQTEWSLKSTDLSNDKAKLTKLFGKVRNQRASGRARWAVCSVELAS